MRLLLCLLTLGLAACSSAPKAPPVDNAIPQPQVQPSPEAPVSVEPKVRQFKDRKAPNWAQKDDDQAFELERPSGCTIKWNVATFHARPKELVITVKDSCRFDLGLSRSLQYYGQILDAILAKYSKDRIKVFQSSSWQAIKAWDQDLAITAIESGLWKNFLKKRQDDPALPSNSVFVDVFNEGNVARKLSEVFETRGLTLRLKSVETVLEKRFKDTAFALEYAAYSSSKVKVPLSAGNYVFDVKLVNE